jgi:hypothetical protein
MKSKRFLGFLVLLGLLIDSAVMLSVLSSAETPTKEDVYWIAFKHINDFSTEQIFLMQIDGLGNIIVPPRPVVPVNAIGREMGAIAIANAGSDKIVLWINKGPKSAGPGFVRKAILSIPGLRFLGIHKTGIHTSAIDSLSVTQKADVNLLAVVTRSKEEHFLSAFGLTLQSLNGSHWMLSPPICEGDICQYGIFGTGTVSSDGRFALVASGGKLFLQRLDGAGRTLGDPKLFNSIPMFGNNTPYYTGSDITGPLSQGLRFVVFGTEAAGTDQQPDKIYLQIVTEQGEKVGDRILLLDGIDSFAGLGSVAVGTAAHTPTSSVLLVCRRFQPVLISHFHRKR